MAAPVLAFHSNSIDDTVGLSHGSRLLSNKTRKIHK